MIGQTDTSRNKLPRAYPSRVIAAVLVIAALPTPQPVQAYSEGIHEKLTRDSLSFLAPFVLNRVVYGNRDEDEYLSINSNSNDEKRHSTNCLFVESDAYMNSRFKSVIQLAKVPPPYNDFRPAAEVYFGRILHGLQDFYSHSNWVPQPPQGLGRTDLFESTLGYRRTPPAYSKIRDDIVIVYGNLSPQRGTIRLPTDASGRVSSSVPIVRIKKSRLVRPGTYRGLMTSVSGNAPMSPFVVWQNCPPVNSDCKEDSADNVCLRHGYGRPPSSSLMAWEGEGNMNMDHSYDDGGDWAKSHRVSRRQTRHEWCRLLHISKGDDASLKTSAIILGTWVREDAAVRGEQAPHPDGTPCAVTNKTHRVKIVATPAGNAPNDLTYALFDTDLTDSRRRTASFPANRSLELCVDPGDKVAAALIAAPKKVALATFNVPLAARTFALSAGGAFNASFAVTVIPNGCLAGFEPR